MNLSKPKEYTKKIVKVKRKMTAQTKSGRLVYRPVKQNTTESEEPSPKRKLTVDLSVSEGIQQLRLKKDLLSKPATQFSPLTVLSVRENDGDLAIPSTSGTIYKNVLENDGDLAMQSTSGTIYKNVLGNDGDLAIPSTSGTIYKNVLENDGDLAIPSTSGTIYRNVLTPKKVIAKSQSENEEILKSSDTINQIKRSSYPQELDDQEIKESGTLTNSEIGDRLEKLEINQIRTLNLLEKTYALLESHIATESKMQRLRRKPHEKLKEFPKKSVEDLEALENEDMDMTRLQLQEHWKAIGATKLRDFIKIALNDSMEPSLIKKITWTGAGNSYKFEDTKMATAMFDSARECSTFEFGQAMRVLKQGFKVKEKGQSKQDLQNVENNGKQYKYVPVKFLEEQDEYVYEYISDNESDEKDTEYIEYVEDEAYTTSDEEI